MTDQRELDGLLVAFFANGTDELNDRVLDAALDQIDHIAQRRGLLLPRNFQTMPMVARLATAAAIGVLAVGGALLVYQRGQPSVGVVGPTPTASPQASPSAPAPTPSRAPVSGQGPTVSPDIPSLAGPMGVGRQIHTATVLADGRVLIAGGYDNKDAALASAVLYDPGTDTFSDTGSLANARGLHTATLLNDGRVLIAGGGPASWLPLPGNGTYLFSAELYDPGTGTFSPTGTMTTARENHTATRLADGRVLIAGGTDLGSHTISSAELYDPMTGTFSPTGSMATARAFHTATLLPDGRVLVAAGDPASWFAGSPMLASAEVYDPETGTFSTTAAMTGARGSHTATLLRDGRVVFTGGSDSSRDLETAELYDPATGAFSATDPMAYGRLYHTATLLRDGRVLVVAGGGEYTSRQFLASAELYDPQARTFSLTGSLIEPRTYHEASLLADGRVLVTGGYGQAAPLASAELYDPATGTFGPAGVGG
jgi:hypothetical protein